MTANSRGATALHINPAQIRALALVCTGNTNHQIQLSRGATALLTHFHFRSAARVLKSVDKRYYAGVALLEVVLKAHAGENPVVEAARLSVVVGQSYLSGIEALAV